ncbi:MAG TPA: polyprenyl synthetase family protein [Solirubrobacterales bacterium]|nr:polyprenyl synthetase family protein [Solirubrobacterales bacterium]
MTRSASVPPPVTAVIDRAGAWLPRRLGEVERLLAESGESHGPALAADAGATLRAGGKRLRPLLVLVCGGDMGGDAAVRSAAAVELVHMATLVHDDVLDSAPLRRGRPTVVATSGRAAATATGDLLFSRAFGLLAETGDGQAVDLLCEASLALARGELAQRADAYDLELTEERYLMRCRLKTARLFESACAMGATARSSATARGAATAESAEAAELRAFGAEIGLAFQLLDDVLDVSGPPERTGKARGTDLLDGTVTLPLILARRLAAAAGPAAANAGPAAAEPTAADSAAREPGTRLSDTDAERLLRADPRDLDPADAERLCDAIAASGALTAVRERGLGMITAAKRRLAASQIDPARRGLLNLLADGVVDRYS